MGLSVAIEANVAQSPGWYLLRLGNRISTETDRFNLLGSYDSGDHPLPTGNRKMRETYRKFQEMSRTNYVGLVSESVRERLRVIGFFTGKGQDQKTDDTAWQIWQSNSLDAESNTVHHKALSLSRSYVIVGPNPDDPTKPIITAEDPRQVIHEPDPIRPRKVIAAMKYWHDSLTGRVVAIVYMPDGFYYYRSANVAKPNDTVSWSATWWEVDDSKYRGGFVKNPIGEVPVEPFINRRERGGMGEFEDVAGIQDRINVTVLDRMVIQAMQAYRQRWMKGVDLEDKDGNPEAPFDPGADLLWAVPDENAAFGDFTQADLLQVIRACESDVRDLAAISRTPPHYLLANIANVSGDALATAESGLTSKVRDRATEFGESWERVIRLAFAFAGGAQAGDDSVIVWADPERRTLSELADAAVKYESAGVPFRERMSLLGFTPSQIDRMEAERMRDALIAALVNPLGVVPGAAPATEQVPLTAPGQTPAPSNQPASPPASK